MPKLINASDRIFVAGASGMVGSAVAIRLYVMGMENLLIMVSSKDHRERT